MDKEDINGADFILELSVGEKTCNCKSEALIELLT